MTLYSSQLKYGGGGLDRLNVKVIPANMICQPNVGLMLGQRRKRWANSKPTLGQRLVLLGEALP